MESWVADVGPERGTRDRGRGAGMVAASAGTMLFEPDYSESKDALKSGYRCAGQLDGWSVGPFGGVLLAPVAHGHLEAVLEQAHEAFRILKAELTGDGRQREIRSPQLGADLGEASVVERLEDGLVLELAEAHVGKSP